MNQWIVTFLINTQQQETMFSTFKEATKFFLDEICNRLHAGGMSVMELDACCWIKSPHLVFPLMFNEVRDRAIDHGWIEDGTSKWIGDKMNAHLITNHSKCTGVKT